MKLFKGFRERGNLWPALLLAAVLPFIVFVYTPTFMYSTNRASYLFPLTQTLPLLVLAFLVAFAVLALPGLFASPRIRRYYVAVLACITLYAWFHGFVVVRDYGPLDGGIKLPAFSPLPLVIGLALVVAGTVLLAKAGATRVMAMFCAVMLVLVVHTGANLLADDKPEHTVDATVFDSVYGFGDENLLVLLLDALQSDVFASAVGRDPELADALDGFTYYPNTVGVGPTTYGSIPTIHSGNPRPPGDSMAEHFRTSIEENSFETELADNDWEVVHVNPIASTCPARIDACVTYQTTRDRSVRGLLRHQAAYMVDLSFFRHAPPELKAAVYNDDDWRLRDVFSGVSAQVGSDIAFEEFARSVRRSDAARAAKFVHFQSTHKPATRRDDCSLYPEPVAMTFDAATDLATCAFTRVQALIQRLKSIDAYDDTTIVIVADHGYRDIGSTRVSDETWKERIGLANPMLAVKPKGAHGSLKTDDAELSIADLKTIVCSLTDGCEHATDDWAEPAADRARLFTDYDWADQFWEASTLKDERHYEIRGPMIDPSSWIDLGPTIVPEVDRLTFDADDAASHFGHGWASLSNSEEGSRWGLARSASLNLRLAPEGPVQLAFDVGTLPELAEGQTLTVRVNGETVGTRPVEGSDALVTFTVGPDVKRRKVDQITLLFERFRPVEGTMSRHERKRRAFAIRFDELRISNE